ncbi:MAG: hypothetical protein J6O73_13970 [Lachnospiraceae bacterium]|nr:hypothetical protein [Lachnospiraceae bacterium]
MNRHDDYSKIYQEIVEYEQGNNELYNGFKNSLMNLVTKIQSLTEKDQEGYKKVSQEELYEIQQLYAHLNKDVAAFKESLDEENPMRNTLDKVSAMVEEDRKGLSSVRFYEGITFPEIISGMRSIDVKIPEAGVQKVSGNLSTREKVVNLKGQTGYFTKETQALSGEELFKNGIYELSKPHPEFEKAYQAVAKHMKDEDILLLENLQPYNKEQETVIRNKLEKFDENKEKMRSRDFLFYYRAMKKELGKEEADEYFNNKEFVESIVQFHKTKLPAALSAQVYNANNIPAGRNVEKRNAAMSTVAQLMGNSGIVAYSTNAVLHNGDEEVKGIFMEEAKGVDIADNDKENSNPEAYREFRQFVGQLKDDECWNTREAKTQIADMQVLDYICGNTDRHTGNMLYEFEKNENNELRLKHITGIDNDCSFGVWDAASGKDFANLVPPEEFGVMRRKTAMHLLTLDDDTLKFMLSDKLQKDEIEAACKRLKEVQNQIRHSMEEEKNLSEEERMKPGSRSLMILDDDDLESIQFKDLAEQYKRSQFFRIDQEVKSLADRALMDEAAESMSAMDKEDGARWSKHQDRIVVDQNMFEAMKKLRGLQKDEFVDVSSGKTVDINAAEREELAVEIVEKMTGVKLTGENNEPDLAAYKGILNHVCIDGVPYSMRFGGDLNKAEDRRKLIGEIAEKFAEQMDEKRPPVSKVTFLEMEADKPSHKHFSYRSPMAPEVTAKKPGFFSWNRKEKLEEYNRQVKAQEDAKEKTEYWKKRSADALKYAKSLNADSYKVTNKKGTVVRKPLINIMQEMAEEDKNKKKQIRNVRQNAHNNVAEERVPVSNPHSMRK